MAVAAPQRISTNPLLVVVRDVGSELLSRTRGSFPPGPTDFNLRRTRQFAHDPLAILLDLYEWMRGLAMRIAMRALLGLDPDDRGRGAAAAEHFERGLSFYGTEFHMRLLRGPGSPWRRLLVSRRALDEIVYDEIAQRRSEP